MLVLCPCNLGHLKIGVRRDPFGLHSPLELVDLASWHRCPRSLHFRQDVYGEEGGVEVFLWWWAEPVPAAVGVVELVRGGLRSLFCADGYDFGEVDCAGLGTQMTSIRS